jgi:hypothetical protein
MVERGVRVPHLSADSDNALEVRDLATYYGRPGKEVLTVILDLLEEAEEI